MKINLNNLCIWDNVPIIQRLMLFAFIVLAFLGTVMATTDFNMMHGALLYIDWDGLLLQSGFMAFWPITLAPLWWKLSFFIIGFLLLLPRILFHTGP